MTFPAAVARVLRLYGDFAGRAGPGDYWRFVLFCVFCLLAVMAANMAVALTFATLLGLTLLALALPMRAVTVRRLHDAGLSSLWALVALVPVASGLVLLTLVLRRGEAGPNRFGPPGGDGRTPVRHEDAGAGYAESRIPPVRGVRK